MNDAYALPSISAPSGSKDVSWHMHTIGLALATVTAIALSFAAAGALGQGPLDGIFGVVQAIDEIEQNLEACAQETSAS